MKAPIKPTGKALSKTSTPKPNLVKTKINNGNEDWDEGLETGKKGNQNWDDKKEKKPDVRASADKATVKPGIDKPTK